MEGREEGGGAVKEMEAGEWRRWLLYMWTTHESIHVSVPAASGQDVGDPPPSCGEAASREAVEPFEPSNSRTNVDVVWRLNNTADLGRGRSEGSRGVGLLLLRAPDALVSSLRGCSFIDD